MSSALDYFERGMRLGNAFNQIGDANRARKLQKEITAQREIAAGLGRPRLIGLGVQDVPEQGGLGSVVDYSHMAGVLRTPEQMAQTEQQEQQFVNQYQEDNEQRMLAADERLQAIDPNYGTWNKNRAGSRQSRENTNQRMSSTVDALLQTYNADSSQFVPAIYQTAEAFRNMGDISSYRDARELAKVAEANPELAVEQLTILQGQLSQSAEGKRFADNAVFTTREVDGALQQGFAVRPGDGRAARFEPIEGGVPKETPETKRERDLEAKRKQLEMEGLLKPTGDGRVTIYGEDGTAIQTVLQGSKAEEDAIEKAEAAKAAGELASVAAQTVFEDLEVARGILKQHGRLASGTFARPTSGLTDTPSGRMKAIIDSVKGNIGIDSLLKIKASGAGLGAIPQAQLEALAGLMGKLDIGMANEDLDYNMARIQEIYADIVRKNGGDPHAMFKERAERVGSGERAVGGVRTIKDASEVESLPTGTVFIYDGEEYIRD